PPLKTPAASTPPAPPAPPPAAAPAPASAEKPPPARPAPAASASGERFEIVVGSFRTEPRAKAVADEVAALVQPVRQRAANGWQQVLAGPFASLQQADEAQQRLERAG